MSVSFSLEVVMLKLFGDTLCVYLRQFPGDPSQLILPTVSVDVSVDRNIESALKRGISEWVNLSPAHVEQVKTIGNATRYPNQWMVAVVYTALFSSSSAQIESGWYPLSQLNDDVKLAYDHLGVVHSCVKRVRNKAQYTTLPMHLVHPEFTLTDLQHVYELLLQTQLEKKSFRRRVLEAGVIEPLNKECRTAARPAQLLQLKQVTLCITSVVTCWEK